MIFVTLGTQDKSFDRLLYAIEKQIKSGNITDEVVVQAGYTKFSSDVMKIYDLLSFEQFDKYMKACNILITHGGVGSILNGLKYGKKIIVAPRLKKYGEHTNDHQLEITKEFVKDGYVLELEDFDRLDEVLLRIKKFKQRKYVSNNKHFVSEIKKYIDNN